MKVGDKVRVIGIPEGLPDNDIQTKQIFELCLGRIFPIEDLKQVEDLPCELVELLVGEVVGEADYMHSIWVESEFLEVVNTAN
jgi:hypothetical protein